MKRKVWTQFIQVILLTTCFATLSHAQLDLSVEYFEGFDDPVLGAKRKEVFAHALNIWAQALDGTIPVKVHAKFENLTSLGVKAIGISTADFQTINGLPSTGYPAALASQLDNTSHTPSSGEFQGFHIRIRFDSATEFYYGQDGNGPTEKDDFVSVVLHELGHGLGFFSRVSTTTGNFISLPMIFDKKLFFDPILFVPFADSN